MKITPSSIAAAMAVKKNMQIEHTPFAALLVGLLKDRIKVGDEITLTYRGDNGEQVESMVISPSDVKVLEKLRKTMW